MNEKDYKIGRIMYVTEETAAYLITILLGGAYLAKLTLSIGFSDSLTAILGSCINLGCVFQLLAISLFKSGRIKNKITVYYTISELLFVFLYVIPFVKIAPGIRTALFITFLLGGNFITNMVSPPKATWYMSMIPDKTRGRFTAGKEAISLVCGVLFQFSAGSIIDHFEATGNTKASFVACGIALLFLTLIHTLSLVFTKETEHSKPLKTSFFKSAHEIITDKSAISIIRLSILWAIANNFVVPFLGTYQVKELGFSMKYVAALATAHAATRIIASVFLGKYADKKSFAHMLRICYILVAVSFAAMVFTMPFNGQFMYAVYIIFMGAAMGGINSAELNLIFDYVTPEKRKNALAIKQTFYGFFGFCATLVGAPVLNAISQSKLTIFGTQIYGQQMLAFISFGISLVLIVYVTKLSKSNTNHQ